MSFREQVFEDNLKVFLDIDSFAEIYTIYSGGVVLEDVPAVLSAVTKSARGSTRYNHRANEAALGMSSYTHTLTCETAIWNGKPPQPRERIRLKDKNGKISKYEVLSRKEEMGLLTFQLEDVGYNND